MYGRLNCGLANLFIMKGHPHAHGYLMYEGSTSFLSVCEQFNKFNTLIQFLTACILLPSMKEQHIFNLARFTVIM